MSYILMSEPRQEVTVSFGNFVRLLFNPPKHDAVPDESLDSLLTTVEDSVHVQVGDGPPLTGNSKIYRIIAKGHESYTASFKSKRKRS